jgi:hypothetical protein
VSKPLFDIANIVGNPLFSHLLATKELTTVAGPQ